jgi:hypothetical protein
VTSSGLSHFFKTGILFDYVFPNDYKYLRTFDHYNFAYINFNWGKTAADSNVDVIIRDIENNSVREINLKYTDLSYDKNRITQPDCDRLINRRFKTWPEYLEYYKNNKAEILIFLVYLVPVFILFLIFKFIFFVIKKIFGLCFGKKSQTSHEKTE